MLLDKRDYYKPFAYPFGFEGYKLQKQMEWVPESVPLLDDVKDWQQKLSEFERNLITQVFRFLAQSDVDVATGYYDYYIPKFRHPELRMMLGAFASMEGVHMHAYALLLDTVGMPEVEYQAFQSFDEMRNKHEYMFRERDTGSAIMDLAVDLGVFSGFGEGMQLFSSFAIIQNFSRFNKLKGMNTIITYIIRDETLHVECMIKLFHQLVAEYPELQTPELALRIRHAARTMVELEDHFIDLAFAAGNVEGLTAAEVKEHIRFIANHRLVQLGFYRLYRVAKTPLDWLDHLSSGVEHVNFFEQHSTDYAKASLTGTWEELGF